MDSLDRIRLRFFEVCVFHDICDEDRIMYDKEIIEQRLMDADYLSMDSKMNFLRA